MLKQQTTLLIVTIVIAFLALPIVRAEGEYHGKDPNGKHHPEGYVDHRRVTCRSTQTVCFSRTTTCISSTTSKPPPPVPSTVIVPVVPCCSPVETVTSIPAEICSTVVLCGVDSPECNGERVRKFEDLVDRMIEDRSKARVFVNNELIVIGQPGKAIATSAVAQQDSSATGAPKRVAGVLAAIACIIVFALAV